MNQFQKYLRRGCFVASILAAFLLVGPGVLTASAGEAAFENETPNRAKNLARMNCGAQIDWITPDGRVSVLTASEMNTSATALIMDDDTLSCPLEKGDNTFIISLGATTLLDRFTFVNENGAAEGEFKIAVSNYKLPAASPKWIEVDGSVNFTRKRLFSLSMVGVEARYVKLSFRVVKTGRIAALGLYGGQSLQAFSAQQRRAIRLGKTTAWSERIEDALNFNFANLYAKARVVFISSGPPAAARQMIDDDTTTAFQFAPSDPRPTVVVELAESENLHRVSALYQMASGQLEVFLLHQLAVYPGDLSGAKSVASVADRAAGGKAAVDFDPQGARYVALRWTPDKLQTTPFTVAEIDAFGNVPLSLFETEEPPSLYVNNIPAQIPPTLSIPADLPVLPAVSPVSP